VYQNDDWRYDTTETGEFTPLPEMVDLLQSLDEPIHVIGFYTFQTAFQRDQAQALLDGMKAYTSQLTYEFQDPDENPLLAQQFELSFDGTLVFTRRDDRTIFAKATSLNDRDIYAALVQVIHPVDKTVYFLTGHGEPDIEDFAQENVGVGVRFLRDAGFRVETLNLFLTGAVPEDATAVILIDPQSPLTADETAALRAYLSEGGALFLARDVVDNPARQQAETDGLNQMLREEWGITLRPDLIVEQSLAQAGQQFGVTFLGANYGFSPIIDENLERFGTIFSVARSIATETVDDVIHVNLITTSDQAWGETNFAAMSAQGIAEPDPGEDAEGSLIIGVSAENQVTNARLVVFGDTDFLRNGLIVQGGNQLLLSNSLNWLARDEIAVDLTPRSQVNREVIISQSQLGLLQALSVCLGPGLLGLVGIAIWSARRRNR
jgi:ABC-type uncharacterized transport system involved in gliding motility auxiliary subunit